MIGDKVFNSEEKYDHITDLSALWKELTGLPFVFAVWVKKKQLADNMLIGFEKALRKGIDQLDFITKNNGYDIDLERYFKKNISYNFDDKKREALNLFFEKIKKFNIK